MGQSAGVEVWRGGVATWECDAMGHLNVGFYVAKAMDGLVGLAAELGMPRAFTPDAQSTLVIREQHIRFIKEARAGDALHMLGGVLAWGESEARLLLQLRHGSGDIAAVFQMQAIHTAVRGGHALPWPERAAERAAALATEAPENARPRSITLARVESQASLKRATALGLKRGSLVPVRPADCDPFGRMRTDVVMSRISDGTAHFFESGRPGAREHGARAGGAALEYRLIYLAWPGPGDRLEVRSGLHSGNARFRTLMHWVLDPLTGRPWAVAENVTVSFDLETRKVITLSDEALAQVNATAIAGLTL